MSFSRFQENIEKEPDFVARVMECALYLRNPEVLGKKTWNDFAKQFFDEYQLVILSYFGLLPEVLSVPRIRLNNRDLFLAVISLLAHRGEFACKREEIAQVLYDRFDLNLEYSSILQYICENNSESYDILSLFNK